MDKYSRRSVLDFRDEYEGRFEPTPIGQFTIGDLIRYYNITLDDFIKLIEERRYQMRQDEIRQIGWKGVQGIEG